MLHFHIHIGLDDLTRRDWYIGQFIVIPNYLLVPQTPCTNCTVNTACYQELSTESSWCYQGAYTNSLVLSIGLAGPSGGNLNQPGLLIAAKFNRMYSCAQCCYRAPSRGPHCFVSEKTALPPKYSLNRQCVSHPTSLQFEAKYQTETW